MRCWRPTRGTARRAREVSTQLLEAASGRKFYNTSKLGFAQLLGDSQQVASNLSAYIHGFSANVRRIFERFGFEEQIARMDEKNLLFQVVQAFARVDLSLERVDNVQMGYVFEELIRIGAEQANEEAGEHFTPREVIRLMVSLLLSHEPDLAKSYVVKRIYDPACGTGGMLSVSEDFLREHNSTANPFLYGQDWNDDAWAVCASDMLIKGKDADHIVLGDTFTADGHARWSDGRRYTFDYMLANPPFGVEWKQQQREIKQERDLMGYDGRFGAGLPRINDGALLFLQHMLSKMQPPENGGSRIAIVFNGSPLFTGDAGSGESEIRRWIIENDWLETIVALPDQLFYNTGISTYIWVLTNRKEERRRGKGQLIDGRQLFVKMRKSLGNKRNELSPAQIDGLTRIHGNFQDGETRELTDQDPVDAPATDKSACGEQDLRQPRLRLPQGDGGASAATELRGDPERTARIEEERSFRNLARSRKRPGPAHDAEVAEGRARQKAIRVLLNAFAIATGGEVMRDRDDLRATLRELTNGAGLRLSAGERKASNRRLASGIRTLLSAAAPGARSNRTPGCATRRRCRSVRTLTTSWRGKYFRTCQTPGWMKAGRKSVMRFL